MVDCHRISRDSFTKDWGVITLEDGRAFTVEARHPCGRVKLAAVVEFSDGKRLCLSNDIQMGDCYEFVEGAK